MYGGHDFATSGRAPTDHRRAPGDLEVLRGFINTEGRYYGIDGLTDARARTAVTPRLLPGFDLDALDEPAWARLVELRSAARAVVADTEGSDELLSRVAARIPLRLTLARAQGGVSARLVAPDDEPEQALAAAVLNAVLVALTDGRIERLRLCERPECGWCYYDATKNRSGRWCSSDPCGDVMKARAFRARHRAASRPEH